MEKILILILCLFIFNACTENVLDEYPRKYNFVVKDLDDPFYCKIENNKMKMIEDPGIMAFGYNILYTGEHPIMDDDNILDGFEIINENQIVLKNDNNYDTLTYEINNDIMQLFYNDQEVSSLIVDKKSDDLEIVLLFSNVKKHGDDFIEGEIILSHQSSYEDFIQQNIGIRFFEQDSIHLNYLRFIYSRAE